MRNCKFFLKVKCLLLFLATNLHGINWANPNLEDLKKLQEKFEENSEEIVKEIAEILDGKKINNTRCRVYKKFQIYTEDMEEVPNFKKVRIGNFNHGKRCIVSYCSRNNTYEKHILEKIEYLKKVGYQGDYIYQIGGWPRINGEALRLYQTPYAFKPCAIKAAIEMGYKEIVWLDASVQPKNNLETVFKHIKEYGFYGHRDYLPFKHRLFAHYLQNLPHLKKYFNLTGDQFLNIPHIGAAVIGLDCSLKKNKSLIDSWLKAAFDSVPFRFPTPEQLSLSVLLWKMNQQKFFNYPLGKNFFVARHDQAQAPVQN